MIRALAGSDHGAVVGERSIGENSGAKARISTGGEDSGGQVAILNRIALTFCSIVILRQPLRCLLTYLRMLRGLLAASSADN